LAGYGNVRDIRRNLVLFFLDGAFYMPAMTLISITAVIPYFLDQAGASAVQIGLAASTALFCSFLLQPVFGHIASHARSPHRTFAYILLTQRAIFQIFVFCIPVFARSGQVMVWSFLVFWAVFNLFVGSYNVFYTPMVVRLLPPHQRGSARGLGFALGSLVGLGAAMLIPVVLSRVLYPYNYMLVFSGGSLLLLIDAALFLLLRQPADAVPTTPMRVVQYVKEMPLSVRTNAPFRAAVLTCLFPVVAGALLTYYTLYAIRDFGATEAQVGVLAALAVAAAAVGYVVFGFAVDRFGPRRVVAAAAILIAMAGVLALTTHSLFLLYVAWVLANLGNSSYGVSAVPLIGSVSPAEKLPLYAGVHSVITQAASAVVLLALAPALEFVGFLPLFAVVFSCGAASLVINQAVLRRRLS